MLGNRTDNDVKNRYHALERRERNKTWKESQDHHPGSVVDPTFIFSSSSNHHRDGDATPVDRLRSSSCSDEIPQLLDKSTYSLSVAQHDNEKDKAFPACPMSDRPFRTSTQIDSKRMRITTTPPVVSFDSEDSAPCQSPGHLYHPMGLLRSGGSTFSTFRMEMDHVSKATASHQGSSSSSISLLADTSNNKSDTFSKSSILTFPDHIPTGDADFDDRTIFHHDLLGPCNRFRPTPSIFSPLQLDNNLGFSSPAMNNTNAVEFDNCLGIPTAFQSV